MAKTCHGKTGNLTENYWHKIYVFFNRKSSFNWSMKLIHLHILMRSAKQLFQKNGPMFDWFISIGDTFDIRQFTQLFRVLLLISIQVKLVDCKFFPIWLHRIFCALSKTIYGLKKHISNCLQLNLFTWLSLYFIDLWCINTFFKRLSLKNRISIQSIAMEFNWNRRNLEIFITETLVDHIPIWIFMNNDVVLMNCCLHSQLYYIYL